MQAGQSGGVQELPEAALRLAGFQRNSIQQQLVIGNAQQKAAVPGCGQALLQFIPSDLELRFRALVIVAVHPRVLDQDVQAVDKGARRGGRLAECRRVRDKALLNRSSG